MGLATDSHMPTDAHGASLYDLWSEVIRFRWLFLTVFLTFLIGAILLAFMSTPIYRATTVLAPVSTEESENAFASLSSQFGSFARLAGIRSTGVDDTSEVIAVMKSRSFTEEFIQAEGLLPALFAQFWDAQTGDWNVEGDDIPTLEDAYRRFDRKIRRVQQDDQTGLVVLTIEWRDSALAAEWANKLVETLNEKNRAGAIDEAQRSLEYLGAELEKTSQLGLREALYRLVEVQVRKIMLANVNLEYSFRVIDPAQPVAPDNFVSPNRMLIITAGLLAGLFLGLVTVLLAEMLTRGAPRR